MNENKRKRYPIDRLKLRVLLKKKEQEALELQEEVERLRQMVKQADIPDAITAIPAEREQIVFPEEEDPLDDEET